MNIDELDLESVDSCHAAGRTRFLYKFVVSDNGRLRKYCTINDIIKDKDLFKYNLNRQKIYRIRHNSFSTGEKGRNTYDGLQIHSIQYERKYYIKQIRILKGETPLGTPFSEDP